MATAPLGSTERTNQLLQEASKKTGIAAPTFGVKAVSPTTGIQGPTTTLLPSQQAPTYPGLMGANIQAKDQQAQAPTYSGLVGGISDQAGRINDTAQQIGTYGQVTPEEQLAKDRLAALPGVQGAVTANIEQHPSDFAFQMGREAVAGRNIESMRQSLAAQQEAQATTRQANTGAFTAQAGAQQNAGGLLGTAAGYAKPEVVGQGQAVFNPLTGETNGGSFDVGTNAKNFAQQVLSKNMTYDQAVSSLAYSPVGRTALDQAIVAAGGNPLQLQAGGAATQNIIGSQTQTVEGYKSALQQGKNLQSQLNDLITTFGLNPYDVNAANLGLQKIAQNTSSPQYKILQNYVNDIANTYAQVLTPPGGSATDTTRGIASSMLDATASGQSLQAVMQSLDAAAQAKIAGVSTVVGTGTIGGSTAGTVQAGGYSFVQDASGKWVPAK